MNYEGILQLLKVMDLAKQWSEFQAIHDKARAELKAPADKLVQDKKPAKPAPVDPAVTTQEELTTFSSDAGAPPAVDRRL